MGIRDRLAEAFSERTGYSFVPHDRLNLLEASDTERRAIQRELDLLAYTALDYVGGQPQELRAVERRKLSQKALVVWMRDPLAGASIDLMNDFVFGRGLSKPKANDKLVQEKLDEAWDDPDNQEVLTSVDAQVRLGTELSLSANLFVKVFDDGDDGKVKLSLLKNDLVETVVRDPEVPQRILWFVCNEDPYVDWDYDNDQPLVDVRRQQQIQKKVYYPHWRNVELMIEEVQAGLRDAPNMPKPDRVGEAKIFHVAVNRTPHMALGHPTMDRLLRWFNAYNRFMDARVDLMEAQAAYVMKRKVKGTPNQLNKMATQALSRRSALGAARDPDFAAEMGPKPASILVENESVEHEPFNLKTNSGEATGDAQMLRANVSASTRFPQTYYGDATNSSLATATSLELPVLKAVESRQEKFESLVRFFLDRVIERAVETEAIPSNLTADERAALEQQKAGEEAPGAPPDDATGDPSLQIGSGAPGAGAPVMEAHEDAIADEEDTARDLGYEFSMPSPLKRMFTDLINAIGNVAKTFDPNNTNVELSRILLGIALSEGLELEDPQGAVEKIFPPGYVDPAIAQAQAAQDAAPSTPFGPDGSDPNASQGADGQQHTEDNPYGASMRSQPPESMGITEAITLGRGAESQVHWLRESRVSDLPDGQRERLEQRRRSVEEDFEDAAAPLVKA